MQLLIGIDLHTFLVNKFLVASGCLQKPFLDGEDLKSQRFLGLLEKRVVILMQIDDLF